MDEILEKMINQISYIALIGEAFTAGKIGSDSSVIKKISKDFEKQIMSFFRKELEALVKEEKL